MKRWTLIYLCSYLIAGGAGFLIAPDLALRLFGSTGNYGDIMPRVTGIFMLALGGLILQFVRARDYQYYRYSIFARSAIVLTLAWLYARSGDAMFIVLGAIVLAGLLPSIFVALTERAPK